MIDSCDLTTRSQCHNDRKGEFLVMSILAKNTECTHKTFLIQTMKDAFQKKVRNERRDRRTTRQAHGQDGCHSLKWGSSGYTWCSSLR
jgi:hypothetical protein